MTDSLPESRQQDRTFRVLFLITVVVLLGFLLVFTSGLAFPLRRGVSDVGLILGGVATAVSCGVRIRSSRGRKRRTWVMLSLAGVSAAVGNTWIFSAHLQGAPEPALSVLFFGIALIMGIGSLLTFPTIKRRGLDLVRILFDGIVLGGSLLSIVGVTIVPRLLAASGNDPAASTTSLVLVLVDIVLATLAAMLVLRGDRADRTVLVLLASGGLFYAISDLARAALTAQGTFEYGGPIDLGWIAGYAMFALGARHSSGGEPVESEDAAAATPPLISSSVTFGLFLVAALFRVAFLPKVGASGLTSVVWVVVLLAMTARQMLLVGDNETLRRDLERRVELRTSELADLTQTSQTMLSSVGDGIYGVDHHGIITFVNPSTTTMLGRPAESLIGQNAHELFHAPQPDGDAFPYDSCYIAEAVREGATTTSEEDTYLGADGQPFPVEVTASPLQRNDVVEGAVVAFRDMTQRREVDKMKSEFVSVVSHELRTPLTSIRGSLGLLSGGALGELTPAASRMVKIALDSSERLTRLINDILDIERIESGTMPMHMGSHQAAELIKTATDQVQNIAEEADVRLQVLGTDGQVWADGDRVVQTLVNLIGNAIKFSDRGSVVDVGSLVGAQMITFSVRDQGRGIPADKLETVFRRFEQVDSSDAREKGGSGLGLAISRSIVERHEGEIWVKSEVGHGAEFAFTIPALADIAPPPPKAKVQTILVCDDDPDMVDVLCRVLEKNGYRAIGVSDGLEAIELAAHRAPAAVLVDLLLEGTSGAQVVAALRSDHRTADVPIVVISGFDPSHDLEVADQSDDWLIKPVAEDRLLRSLSGAIAHHAISGEVLLVEDDDALASVVKTLLERRGLTVIHAHSRSEALELVQGGRPGVLILDLQLSDGDGKDVVQAMRTDQRLIDLPVVIYSASDVPHHQRDDLRLGPTIFLTKGRISPEHLEQRVLELIEMVLTEDQQPRPRTPEPV